MKLTDNYYPYYCSLSAKKREHYNAILKALLAGKKSCTIFGFANMNDLMSIFFLVLYDHPEIFWVSTKIKAVGSIAGVTLNFTFNSLGNNLNANINRFREAAKEFLVELKGRPALLQQKLVHDRLVQRVTYEHNDLDQTAFSAIVNKKSVCTGYSKAFQYLMQELGFKCFYCFGDATSTRETGRHAWNIIQLVDTYYNIDITWDDCYDKHVKNKVDYEYYNCTDSYIGKTHKRDPVCELLPKCNDSKYSYAYVSRKFGK